MSKIKTLLLLVLVIVGLSVFLLRENEAKVRAESQLKNIQYKAASLINEKGNAINELETQVGEQEARLVDFQESYEKALTAKSEEIQQLTADFQMKETRYAETAVQKNKAIQDLEVQTKQNAEKFDKQLKKKNTDISEMGEELRKTTERLAKTLKKQESVESENMNLQTQFEAIQRQVQALKRDNSALEAQLKEQLKAAENKPVIFD